MRERHPRPRLWPTALVLAAVCGAFGCSGSGGGAAPNACRLLTQKEVEAAVGAPVGEPEPREIPAAIEGRAASRCRFPPRSPSATESASLVVVVFGAHVDPAREFERIENELRTNASAEPGVPLPVASVAGVGDQAYWVADLGQLNVLRGRTYLILSLHGHAKETTALDAAKALARDAVARLP